MGNVLGNHNHIAAAEYLADEELSSERREYLDGVVFTISGGSAAHSRITANISGHIGNQLSGKTCEAFGSDTRVRVRAEKGEFYYYPDVTVDCSGRPNDSQYAETPSVIFEVLSPATERVDRVEKLHNYQQIPSLQAYVLVDQLRVAVTVYRRVSGGWESEVLVEKDEVLSLPAIECALPLSAIYERTGL